MLISIPIADSGYVRHACSNTHVGGSYIMPKKPRINSYVVFDKKSCTKEQYDKYYKKDFDKKLFVFLGEIKQCPGHCILTDLSNGRIIGMYHTDNFREATEDEC